SRVDGADRTPRPGRGNPRPSRRQGPQPAVVAGRLARCDGRCRRRHSRQSSKGARALMTETLTVERDPAGFALVTIARPKALNALNSQVLKDIVATFDELDADPDVSAIVLTGSEKAFAAGADIKEMKDFTYSQAYAADWFAGWDGVGRIRKPIIA